jgi:choline dehydrogenase-like flavoprotein
MIVDGRRLEPDAVLSADIAVVGAGVAGLTLAIAVTRAAPGMRVLVIEGGGRAYDFADQSQYFAGAGETHPRHPPLELYRRRMLGGTSSIWGGRCIPMSEDDFLPRPDLGRGGWPIPHDDVARHLAGALEILEAGANEFGAANALPGQPPMLGPAREGSGLVLDRIERFSPPTDLGRRYARELENADNLTILLNTACLEVLTDEDGTRAEGLVLRAGGKAITARAPRIVIAAGGLETPRLLLWSRRARPCGLGNESDQLGRNYMCHYVGDLGHIRFGHRAESLHVDYARSRDGVWCRRLMLLDDKTRAKHGLLNFVLRPTIPAIHDPGHRSAVLSSAYFAKRFLIPEYARRLAAMPAGVEHAFPVAAHAGNVARGLPGLIGFAAMWTRRRILPRRKIPSLFLPARNGVYPLEFNVEELPSRESRVRLGDVRDPNGVPRISVSWRVAPDFPGRLLKIYEVFGNAVRTSGLGDVQVSGAELEQAGERCHAQGGHHTGTARMSAAPSEGVVDPDLQLWGTRGLYVLGSAVFPTCGFANPTLTITALALRLADHLTRARTGRKAMPAAPHGRHFEPAE